MKTILSSVNCLADPIAKKDRVRFASRVRCDVLADALEGNPPNIDYPLLDSFGHLNYRIRDYSADPLQTVMVSDFADAIIRFYEINGAAFSPYKSDNCRHEEITSRFVELPAMSPEDMVPHWRRIDAAALKVSANMRRVIVHYDISRLINADIANHLEGRIDTFSRMATVGRAMIQTLVPLGWEVWAIPFGAPPGVTGRWCHYNWQFLDGWWRKHLPEAFQ